VSKSIFTFASRPSGIFPVYRGFLRYFPRLPPGHHGWGTLLSHFQEAYPTVRVLHPHRAISVRGIARSAGAASWFMVRCERRSEGEAGIRLPARTPGHGTYTITAYPRGVPRAIVSCKPSLRLQRFCSLQELEARRVRENGGTPFPLHFRRRSGTDLPCHGCSLR
jgi:hypothetical protein